MNKAITELKAFAWILFALGIITLLFLSGCTTVPPANINIGGKDSCPPSKLTINIINDTDKAVVGEGDINDDDSGLANPTLGL